MFSLANKQWNALKENVGGHHRVDPPVGLSGHSVTKINDSLLCVIGREGSVRIQRRFGQIYFLHLDLEPCPL